MAPKIVKKAAAKPKVVAKKKAALKLPPKKAAAKAPAKKPAKLALKSKPKAAAATFKRPAAKAPVKKLSFAKKPAPAAAVSPARPPIGDNDYRKLRKYTVPKLEPFVNPTMTPEIRAKIGSKATGMLMASELVRYLAKIEAEMPDWKAKRLPPADGKPRRRGRPPKAVTAAAKAKPKKVANPSATLAQAAAGGLFKPRPAAAAAPVINGAAPVPRVFKLPFKVPVPAPAG